MPRGSEIKWDFRVILSEFMSTKSRSECWEWPGVRTGKKGAEYGVAWNGERQVRAHRWAYEEIFGPLSPGDDGLHKCDNPICFNPWHIFPGDDQANADDKVVKGRACRVLTPEEVAEVALDVRRYEETADRYGISVPTVSEIKTGRKHAKLLASLGIVPVLHEERHRVRKLTEDEARAIYYDKRTVRVIAAEYGVSSPTVVGIKNGDYWQHIHQEAMSRGDANVKKGPGKGIDPDTILAIYEAKGSQTAIAKQYGITQATVSRIKARQGMYATLIDAALASRKDAA